LKLRTQTFFFAAAVLNVVAGCQPSQAETPQCIFLNAARTKFDRDANRATRTGH
jgi:hypothetical protein